MVILTYSYLSMVTRFLSLTRTACETVFNMASDGARKIMPTIYVASRIPKIHEYVIESVPQGVEVKTMHLESMLLLFLAVGNVFNMHFYPNMHEVLESL